MSKILDYFFNRKQNNCEPTMEKYNLVRLREDLARDEGVVHAIYLDHLGHATFGIGHLVTPSDPEHGKPVGTPVSEARVQAAFESDVNIAIQECKKLYGAFDSWPAAVQEILINMMFNLGRPRLSQFVKMNAALNSRDWRLAARHGRDSKWYRQVSNRAERLMTRLENTQ
jgi:lysozyme